MEVLGGRKMVIEWWNGGVEVTGWVENWIEGLGWRDWVGVLDVGLRHWGWGVGVGVLGRGIRLRYCFDGLGWRD